MAKVFNNNDYDADCLNIDLTTIKGEVISLKPVMNVSTEFVLLCIKKFDELEKPILQESMQEADLINNELNKAKQDKDEKAISRMVNKIADFELRKTEKKLQINITELSFMYGKTNEWWRSNTVPKTIYAIVDFVGGVLGSLAKK